MPWCRENEVEETDYSEPRFGTSESLNNVFLYHLSSLFEAMSEMFKFIS